MLIRTATVPAPLCAVDGVTRGRRCPKRARSATKSHGTTYVRKRDNSTAGATADIPSSTIVVGGGPCGLTVAMALAQIGYQSIEVWDKRPRPQGSLSDFWGDSDRSYNIGVVERGQNVLKKLGIWGSVVKAATPLRTRTLWTPQDPKGRTGPSRTDPKLQLETHALQRDRLVACLLEHIDKHYIGKVHVRHSMTIDHLSVEEDGFVSLKWSQTHSSKAGSEKSWPSRSGSARAEFVVGADGANSAVRAALEKQGLGDVKCVNLEEKRENTRVYKTIIFPRDPGDVTVSYSERSARGRVLETLPTIEGRSVGLVLFKVDDEEVSSISTEEEAAEFLQNEFPNMYKKIPQSEITAFVERAPGQLPTFKYVGPALHYNRSIVLVGDAIHTVKPYFGLGVNAAIEDAAVLQQCLKEHPDDRGAALSAYSKDRVPDSKALVKESHRADLGFIQFVLPVILDSMFSKWFPWLFEKQMFGLMARTGMRFREVVWRKRRDRFLQFAMIGTAVAVAVKLIIVALRNAARMVFA